MLTIDTQGMVSDARVKPRRFPTIERGKLTTISGIIIHQTGGASEQSAFQSYKNPMANGAHFLIAKDGEIFQTASLLSKTNHVGKLRARCIVEHSCSASELIFLKKASSTPRNKAEMKKSVPGRYPSNQDSIGIEIVGQAALPPGKSYPANSTDDQKRVFLDNNGVYESVTAAQNLSLKWLVNELIQSLKIPDKEVHRHPDVSQKNPTEASTAKW